jgi:hypothetical protein
VLVLWGTHCSKPGTFFYLSTSPTVANDTCRPCFIFTIRIVGHTLGYCFSMHYVYLSCTPLYPLEDTAGRKQSPMVKRPPSKDEALEALDFIINVLREHEKDLDRLIGELGTITSSVGKTGEMADKIEKVEERLSTLQNEITGLIGILSTSPRTTPVPHATTATQLPAPRGPPVIVRCKQWDDFRTLAKGADTVSFLFREAEKGFQADALKDGRVLTYSGELPKDSRLLKLWLAKELEMKEESIFEGILAIG